LSQKRYIDGKPYEVKDGCTMKLKIAAIKLLLRLMGFIKGNRYKYSQEYEDNFKYMGLGEKLWWGYKALIKQVEKAEKDKGIEEYFRNQDLSFDPPVSFKIEHSMTLTAGGDLSCSEIIYPESTVHLWDDIEDFYFPADIVCANLESPLDPERPSSGVPEVCLTAPDLNTTPEMFERYFRGGNGINLFSTANNHSLDMGEKGLVATLDYMDSMGCIHVGTSRTPEEQMDIPVIEKNGIKVAFVSYTYSLNRYDPIPGKGYMTNMLRLNKPDTDLSLIKEHVKAAHSKNADIIVAMLHWSVEFETYPIRNVIDMGHRILEECGADIILGGHAHVAQPMEKYRFRDPFSGVEKDGFIIYSLGEFVSYNAFSRNSRLATILKLEISKGSINGITRTLITGLKVLPVYTWVRKFANGRWDYRLVDFLKAVRNIEEGINSYGFNTGEIKELIRLKDLLYEKLLPANCSGLLQEK